jgi:stearoyl-CoA desaturase (delta-9 desaturase)
MSATLIENEVLTEDSIEESEEKQVPEPRRKFGRKEDEKLDWVGSMGFFGIHAAALLIFVVGFSWIALAVCILCYIVRMFGITGGYHRYFSHRTYKTTRWFQFVIAWLGASSAQKGPLWWAAHHRHHHSFSDTEEDLHSPTLRGLWWAHVGWILCKKYTKTNYDAVKDLAKFPELRFLNKYHILPPFALAVSIFLFGALVNYLFPSWGTSGSQMLVWGFFVSTTFLYHGTFTINSLSHVFGRRRFKTRDDSRNNWLLAIITLGEGWHNNHHFYPGSERQGFYWWEIDVSHYILKTLSAMRLVWDLRVPPKRVLEQAKRMLQGETSQTA